jgi:hypothetical protein
MAAALTVAIALLASAGAPRAAPPLPAPLPRVAPSGRETSGLPLGPPRRDREPESRIPRAESAAPPAGGSSAAQIPASVGLFHAGGCHLGPGRAGAVRAFGTRLLAREPAATELLSLEAWSTKDTFRPGDRVLFQLRSTRRAYVTLFWIGPDGAIAVALDAAPIPANSDVAVDADAVIVPPLGTERWVAVARVERAPFPCGAPPDAWNAWLARASSRPHAVARWEVKSAAAGR